MFLKLLKWQPQEMQRYVVLSFICAGLNPKEEAQERFQSTNSYFLGFYASQTLFNQGRALESQGNMAAAQRIYSKVTQISPRFIYGWSNLANTQVAFGDLGSAEENYSKAIELCKESVDRSEEKFGVRRCSDMYVLRLNRGTVRLNNGMLKEANAE